MATGRIMRTAYPLPPFLLGRVSQSETTANGSLHRRDEEATATFVTRLDTIASLSSLTLPGARRYVFGSVRRKRHDRASCLLRRPPLLSYEALD